MAKNIGLRGGVKLLQKALKAGKKPENYRGDWEKLSEVHASGQFGWTVGTMSYMPDREIAILGTLPEECRVVLRFGRWVYDDAPSAELTAAAPTVAAPALELERGCSRCGDPLDAKAKRGKRDVCTPCAAEKAAKPEMAPAVTQAAEDDRLVISDAEAAKLKQTLEAAADFARRELGAQKFNPPRDEYSRTSVSEERTMICRNPFAETPQ